MGRTKSIKYKYSIKEYFLILLFLFSSGSIIWFHVLSPAFSHIIYFSICLCAFIHQKKKLKHYKSFPIIFSILILINITFINTNVVNRTGIGTIIATLGSYLFFQLFDFYKFRYLYIKVVGYLTLASIIVFFFTEIELLPLYSLTDATGKSHDMFLIFHIGWPYHFHRLTSIWHEPGACMIFLNIAFLLYIPELKSKNLNRREALYLSLIALGILCTQSTTGYIAFILILGYCTLFSTFLPSYKKILLIILCGGIITTLFYSDVIQEKLNQDEDEITSKGVRMRDNLACLEMAIDNPITGVGFGTKEFIKTSEKLDNTTNSNGILLIAAYMGIIFVILYFIYAYRYVCKWNNKLDAIFIVCVFFILESNEAFVEFPVSFIFMAKFYSYKYFNSPVDTNQTSSIQKI